MGTREAIKTIIRGFFFGVLDVVPTFYLFLAELGLMIFNVVTTYWCCDSILDSLETLWGARKGKTPMECVGLHVFDIQGCYDLPASRPS